MQRATSPTAKQKTSWTRLDMKSEKRRNVNILSDERTKGQGKNVQKHSQTRCEQRLTFKAIYYLVFLSNHTKIRKENNDFFLPHSP